MKKLLPLFALLIVLLVPCQVYAKVWTYTQITDTTTSNNRHPSRSGNDIVWCGTNENGKYSIMHHNLETGETKSLTAGVLTGHFGMASVNNGLVAIRAYDWKETHNYYVYDLATGTAELIYSAPVGAFEPYWGYQPSFHSIDPMIHNGEVVFAAWDGNDYEIMSWKDGVVTQITDNDFDDYEPQVWNGQISWTGWIDNKTTHEVFYYDGENILNASDRRGKDEDSFIADGKIMWTGQSYEIGDPSFNVYSYDIETGEVKREQQSAGNNYEPAIYQNTFGWHRQTYHPETQTYDYQVWYSDGYKEDRLHFGEDYDLSAIGPYVYKDSVVFSQHDGTVYQLVMASYKTGGYNPDKYEGSFRDVLTVGTYAYAAQGNVGIGVYDLSDPSKPVKVAQAGTDGTVFDLAQQGGTLYAAAREGGVEVYDISGAGTIARVSTIDVEGAATKLLLNNDALYVGGREGGLSIIDTASMSVIGHTDLPGLAMGLDILDEIAYVAGYTSGLHIVDVSDPTSPTLLSTLSNIGVIWDVTIYENTAFLSVAGYGIKAYDLDDPLKPTLLGSLEMPNGDMDGGWLATFEMIIYDNIAFVSAGTQGIFAVDVSDPENMRIIERYETPEFAWTATIYDKYLLGADYTDGFNLYDITDHAPGLGATPIPASLLLLGSGLTGLGLLKRKRQRPE